MVLVSGTFFSISNQVIDLSATFRIGSISLERPSHWRFQGDGTCQNTVDEKWPRADSLCVQPPCSVWHIQ